MPLGHRLPSFERERFQDVLEDDGLRTVVVERDGELTAHSTFGHSRDGDAAPEVGEIRTFFVRPSAWRHGVGSALMAAVLDGLGPMGFAGATLWSFADNQRANAFYERFGFRRDGAEQREEAWADLRQVRYRRLL